MIAQIRRGKTRWRVNGQRRVVPNAVFHGVRPTDIALPSAVGLDAIKSRLDPPDMAAVARKPVRVAPNAVPPGVRPVAIALRSAVGLDAL
jgi:hypothetical protein